ncbi:uncharacterized protein Tco025E_07376 [Trypanosoma conorhini]|uniref:Uncharacterized protein n=1 Tax=Trypanosoma conorhini TaxID=83891 RepID=A0A422NPP9_9TRYP|nr:uncharacterized protein Tco025E_07376 [Trypanosoma conorhini]RNF07384.1 hypothetical protein Tco025E_07376 [Trypanosoma conorhini]
MITEELFSAFVQQAWCDLAAPRAETQLHGNGDPAQRPRQQQPPRRCGAPSMLDRAAPTASARSPLDHPDLLMAYYNASRNALLRYHCDVPFLQPRATYPLHQRVSPAFVGQPSMRPPRHHARSHARSHAPTASNRNSSAYAHGRHEGEAPSPPTDASYRVGRHTELRGPTVMPNTVAEPSRSSWGAFTEDDDMLPEEGRPSWSPRQMRYRLASGSSAGYPRESSGVPVDALNYGCFSDDDDDDNDDGDGEELVGRPTVRLGPPRGD